MLMVLGRSDVKFLRRELLFHIQQAEGKPITIPDLAQKLECGYNTILRHREALKKQGYIQWKTRRGRDTGGSIYQLSEKATTYLEGVYGGR